jgi:hypothetical protein
VLMVGEFISSVGESSVLSPLRKLVVHLARPGLLHLFETECHK